MAEKAEIPKAKAADTQMKIMSDIINHDLRNHFAGIALREIVRNQMINNRFGQEDVAASYAYRYADKMLDASKVVSRKTVVSRGVVAAPSELLPEPPSGSPVDALAGIL